MKRSVIRGTTTETRDSFYDKLFCIRRLACLFNFWDQDEVCSMFNNLSINSLFFVKSHFL